jgi:cell shape-determining protein MreC
MRRLRFNQVFTVLVLLCLLSAFVLPQKSQSWSNVQAVFAPVSVPAGHLAARLIGTVHSNATADPRSDADIRTENQQLKVEISQLEGQLQALSKIAAERRQLGSLLNYCVSAQVIGSDSDDRQALNLQQSDPPALSAGQAVVCPLGLVGRIQSAAPTGAKVLLITDKGARPVSVSFGRMVRQDNGAYGFNRLTADRTLIYGHGDNQLVATQGLSLAAVKSADLHVGDWAVLDDSDYPLSLAGLCVGQVTAISPSITSPLYADIVLRPATNLLELQEVLVVTKH